MIAFTPQSLLILGVSLSVDEGSAFDALKTLADLSLMMPETNPDTGKTFMFLTQ